MHNESSIVLFRLPLIYSSITIKTNEKVKIAQLQYSYMKILIQNI